ncbi:MAG: hypothetical protein ACM31M_01875, partial [Nitrososphaerota archaeon]
REFWPKNDIPYRAKITDADPQDYLKLCCPLPNLHENLDFALTSLLKDKIFNQLPITRFSPTSKLLVDRLYMLNYTMMGSYCRSCRGNEKSRASNAISSTFTINI